MTGYNFFSHKSKWRCQQNSEERWGVGKRGLSAYAKLFKISLLAHFLGCQPNTFSWHFQIKKKKKKKKKKKAGWHINLVKEYCEAGSMTHSLVLVKINLGKIRWRMSSLVWQSDIMEEKYHVKIVPQKYSMASTLQRYAISV